MIFIIIIAISLPSADNAAEDLEKEKSAIRQTALDYLEGWYEGNAERMERALHPDLVKRVPQTLPSGYTIIENLSSLSMVVFTRSGYGKESAQNRGEVKVEIFDMFGNIASAKTTCGEYIDYLHLVKIDGAWKILNVLWVPNNTGTTKRQ